MEEAKVQQLLQLVGIDPASCTVIPEDYFTKTVWREGRNRFGEAETVAETVKVFARPTPAGGWEISREGARRLGCFESAGCNRSVAGVALTELFGVAASVADAAAAEVGHQSRLASFDAATSTARAVRAVEVGGKFRTCGSPGSRQNWWVIAPDGALRPPTQTSGRPDDGERVWDHLRDGEVLVYGGSLGGVGRVESAAEILTEKQLETLQGLDWFPDVISQWWVHLEGWAVAD